MVGGWVIGIVHRGDRISYGVGEKNPKGSRKKFTLRVWVWPTRIFTTTIFFTVFFNCRNFFSVWRGGSSFVTPGDFATHQPHGLGVGRGGVFGDFVVGLGVWVRSGSVGLGGQFLYHFQLQLEKGGVWKRTFGLHSKRPRVLGPPCLLVI